MALVTMVNMCKERSMEKVNSPGLMVARTKVNSLRITYKVKESIIGPMEGSTMDNGSIIRWKATVYSHGPTEDATKAHMSTIRKKVKEISIGQMAVNTKAAGKMESSMASALTRLQAVRRNRANGPMVRDFTGSRIHKDNSEEAQMVKLSSHISLTTND